MKRFFSLFLVVVLLLAAVPTFYASAVDTAIFTVGKATGDPGEEVDVKVSITSNPGLTCAQVLVGYDATVFEVVEITGLTFEGKKAVVSPTTANPLSIIWCDALTDTTATGDIATITFKIKDDAVGGIYTLTATSDQENVFDTKFNDVPFKTVNGYVDVKNSNVDQQTSSQVGPSENNTSSSQVESSPWQNSSQSETSSQITSNVESEKDNTTKPSVNSSTQEQNTVTDGAIDSDTSKDIGNVDNDNKKNKDGNNDWLIWVVVAAIIVLAGAFAAFIIISRKK